MKVHPIIYRSGPPSEYDTAPYLSECHCPDSIWVQISLDEDVPLWIEFKSQEDADHFIKQKL